MKKNRQNGNDTKLPRGRHWPNGKPFPEQFNLALEAGTLARIKKALKPNQSQRSFIRDAINDKLA